MYQYITLTGISVDALPKLHTVVGSAAVRSACGAHQYVYVRDVRLLKYHGSDAHPQYVVELDCPLYVDDGDKRLYPPFSALSAVLDALGGLFPERENLVLGTPARDLYHSISMSITLSGISPEMLGRISTALSCIYMRSGYRKALDGSQIALAIEDILHMSMVSLEYVREYGTFTVTLQCTPRLFFDGMRYCVVQPSSGLFKLVREPAVLYAPANVLSVIYPALDPRCYMEKEHIVLTPARQQMARSNVCGATNR